MKLTEKDIKALDKIPEGELVESMMNVVYENKTRDPFTLCVEQYLNDNYDGITNPRKEGVSYKKPSMRIVE